MQLLVETGLLGLLIGLWAALAALAAARHDPWLFAALAGVLMHAFVGGLNIRPGPVRTDARRPAAHEKIPQLSQENRQLMASLAHE